MENNIARASKTHKSENCSKTSELSCIATVGMTLFY